jgi:hypothetical protein
MYRYIKCILIRLKYNLRFRHDIDYKYDNKHIEMYIINNGYEQ